MRLTILFSKTLYKKSNETKFCAGMCQNLKLRLVFDCIKFQTLGLFFMFVMGAFSSLTPDGWHASHLRV